MSRFHPDEQAVQQRLGVRQRMEAVGSRNVRDFMPEQHRQFFGELPFFFVGALDAAGQPWATVLAGDPGFLSTPDARTLHIAGTTLPGDPLQGQLRAGDYIGGLGLVPATRRRNRVNGVITAADAGGLRVEVRQSFGNCPQYIQARRLLPAGTDAGAAAPSQAQVLRARGLSEQDRLLIAGADTLFIASANVDLDAGEGRGVDVSHRGGRPGFVQVADDGTLTVPDFVGNFFFNTIGNLVGHPRAGLLFVDFDSGDLLHVVADAEIVWDGPEVQAFAGAERLMRFRVREVVRNVAALPLRWSAPEPSVFLERTGVWQEAEAAMAAHALRNAWRPFAVAAIVQESVSVRSFYLEPADGHAVAPHLPGQHIPIRVFVPGQAAPLLRTYTLSDAANGRQYRISVKRDGVASAWLHEGLEVGSRIEVMGPRGEFVFDASAQRPAVLLSAGIGITPMIAMLNDLLVNGSRSRHPHPIYFIHGARNRGEHAFAEHVRALEQGHGNVTVHVRYSRPDGAEPALNDSVGHVDIALLQELLPFGDYDFYLCGPAPFMQQMYDGLRALNVAPERIRFEAFGPATVRREAVRADSAAMTVAEGGTAAGALTAVPVRFARSDVTLEWDAGKGSLLELAESHGIDAPYSCRSGVCGSCATPVLAGGVRYTRDCAASVEAGEVLMCSAVPDAASAVPLVLDL
jgi:ferredoxin-NADP reductase/predicted pyridoxine 5'-phosphate oxidase superfamily flavin-nucleotide-binding protein